MCVLTVIAARAAAGDARVAGREDLHDAAAGELARALGAGDDHPGGAVGGVGLGGAVACSVVLWICASMAAMAGLVKASKDS